MEEILHIKLTLKVISAMLGRVEKNRGKKMKGKKIRRKEFSFGLLGRIENERKENERKMIFLFV